MIITLLIISKNVDTLIEDAILSAIDVVDKIVVVDNDSIDLTCEVARKYNCEIMKYDGNNLGSQRLLGLSLIKNGWVLVLDADERLSTELKSEIEIIKKTHPIYNGFLISYQNFFLGKRISYGGESYSKIRLFRSNSVLISDEVVHTDFELKKGTFKLLNGKILHYSYRSLWQTYCKFTSYAFREAQQKFEKGEKSSLKKIFMYGPHMFWARFIKDKGYKDGMFRIPLDLGFAYMEFLTYFLLAIKSLKLLKK